MKINPHICKQILTTKIYKNSYVYLLHVCKQISHMCTVENTHKSSYAQNPTHSSIKNLALYHKNKKLRYITIFWAHSRFALNCIHILPIIYPFSLTKLHMTCQFWPSFTPPFIFNNTLTYSFTLLSLLAITQHQHFIHDKFFTYRNHLHLTTINMLT